MGSETTSVMGHVLRAKCEKKGFRFRFVDWIPGVAGMAKETRRAQCALLLHPTSSDSEPSRSSRGHSRESGNPVDRLFIRSQGRNAGPSKDPAQYTLLLRPTSSDSDPSRSSRGHSRESGNPVDRLSIRSQVRNAGPASDPAQYASLLRPTPVNASPLPESPTRSFAW